LKKGYLKKRIKYSIFRTVCGWCGCVTEGDEVVYFILPHRNKFNVLRKIKIKFPLGRRGTDSTIKMVMAITRAYFRGDKMKKLDSINISMKGLTSFQKIVYNFLLKNVGFGKTITYGEVSRCIKKPGGARAVGGVLRRNPVPLFIPCHRVISKNGIGGFSGGVKMKKFMLKLERE